jgi:hypothetical protein
MCGRFPGLQSGVSVRHGITPRTGRSIWDLPSTSPAASLPPRRIVSVSLTVQCEGSCDRCLVGQSQVCAADHPVGYRIALGVTNASANQYPTWLSKVSLHIYSFRIAQSPATRPSHPQWRSPKRPRLPNGSLKLCSIPALKPSTERPNPVTRAFDIFVLSSTLCTYSVTLRPKATGQRALPS